MEWVVKGKAGKTARENEKTARGTGGLGAMGGNQVRWRRMKARISSHSSAVRAPWVHPARRW